MIIKKLAFCAVVLVIFTNFAQSQEIIRGSILDIIDPKAIIANPALVSFQRPKLALGAKVYHFGLSSNNKLAYKQGFFTLSSPFILWKRLGIGISGHHFDSPIFRKTSFGLYISARAFGFMSIGANLSSINLAYNDSNFDLVDLDDPVFRSGTNKLVLNSSIGVYVKPFENLSIAFGSRNLNEPNLSLINDDVRLFREPFGGVSLSLGPLRATFEASYYNDKLESRVLFEAFSVRGNFLRAGGTNHSGTVEGQMHLSGPISLNYNYELPFANEIREVSQGSHLMTLIFEFGRLPKLPELLIPPDYFLETDEMEILPEFRPRIYISSKNNYARIFEKKIVREIDPGIPREAILRLSNYDIGVLDSSFKSINKPFTSQSVENPPVEVAFEGSISPQYQKSIDVIRNNLKEASGNSLQILTQQSQLTRASGLYNLIQKDDKLSPTRLMLQIPKFNTEDDSLNFFSKIQSSSIQNLEGLIILDPQDMNIELLSAFIKEDIRSWELTIKDQYNNVVKTFSGKQTLPSSINWNWQDNFGQIIRPGVYSYKFQWQDLRGENYSSNEGNVYIQKFMRKITIRITQDPGVLGNESKEIELFIHK